MKMGDGGFRPAFNVQLATATDSQIITGVGPNQIKGSGVFSIDRMGGRW
jgi:hypothetical protein